MRKINLKVVVGIALLIGIALLGKSCKRDFEIEKNTSLTPNQTILNTKAYVDSLVSRQGPDGYIKKMNFEINWEKAIVDTAGNVRVPMIFDLSKFKPKDGKQITIPETKTVYELFVKNDGGLREVSIMQFMNLKGKYYPLRFNLNGQELTKLGSKIAEQVLSTKSKQLQLIKGAKPAFDKTMITESGFIELVQGIYGQSYLAAILSECPIGTMFEPTTCLCDFPENVTNGTFYPELYMTIASSPGSFQVVPYPFSFHPSEITPDPEYPEEPIGGGTGNTDCAGVVGGTAYTTCCGCIGGTTGITDCSQLSDNPNTTASASITEVAPSAESISMLTSQNYWGYSKEESVELTIGATLSDCVWKAVLISAKGNYSVQARLLAGCKEVADTDSNNFCDQVAGLKGTSYPKKWYMLSAVMAHENVHVTRLLPALNNVLSAIANDVKTLSVPATGQSKAQAISQLMNLSAFQTIKGQAYIIWGNNYFTLIEHDHDPGGETDTAEAVAVAPTGTSICILKSLNPSWPTCTGCPS